MNPHTSLYQTDEENTKNKTKNEENENLLHKSGGIHIVPKISRYRDSVIQHDFL